MYNYIIKSQRLKINLYKSHLLMINAISFKICIKIFIIIKSYDIKQTCIFNSFGGNCF